MTMTNELLHIVEDKLKANFGADIISAEQQYDFPVFVIRKEKIIEVIQFLHDEEGLGFRFLTTMCGLHFPGNKGQEIGVMYQLHNLQKNWRIRLKSFTDINDPVLPTLTGIFSTANWMEREA